MLKGKSALLTIFEAVNPLYQKSPLIKPNFKDIHNAPTNVPPCNRLGFSSTTLQSIRSRTLL